VLLVVSVLAGGGAAAWLARLHTRRLAAAGTVLLVLVLLAEYRTPPDVWPAPRPAAVPELGLARGSVVVEMPMAPPERLDQSVDADYMVNRIGAWPKLVNGYSGFYPAAYLTFADRTRDFPDERSIREMARVGVSVLAVHERWYGPRFGAIVAELDSRADVERIGEYFAGEKRVAVYQVLRRF
jgi:hypothetical protein